MPLSERPVVHEPSIFPYLFSGKLLLRNEIPLDEPTFQHQLSTKNFTPIVSMKRKNFTYQCQRCGNQQRSLFAQMPCASCGTTHAYCRNCIEMGRVMECEPLYYWSGEEPHWPPHETPCSWEGELTLVQQRAAERITRAINTEEKELLIWAVCGSGKTEMLFPGITEALHLGKRVCIATPRADVVRELLPRIQKAFRSIEVQGLYGGSEKKEGTAQIIIATTHQLLRYKSAFDVLIIDEIDAFPFHADPTLPYVTNRAKSNTSTTIYLTATPRKNLHKQIMQKKLVHIFVPIRFHGHPLPVPKLKMSFSLKRELVNKKVPQAFMKWIKNRENPDRQLLIFVPTIQLAETMKDKVADCLLNVGLIKAIEKAQAVHASDPNREEKVQLFRDRKIDTLLTTTILERGVTFPSVDVAILDTGHEVFDEAALVQIAGRAGRSPDDPTGEVIFFHDGKTEAMMRAVQSIRQMNKRGSYEMYCLWCNTQIIPEVSWGNLFLLTKPKWLCQACEGELEILQGKRCRCCSRVDEDELCSDCKWWDRHFSSDPITFNFSVFSYNLQMQDMIAKWKYRGDYHLGNAFKPIFRRSFHDTFSFLKKDAIAVPIPLSKERLLERGFNQAKMLADFLPVETEEIITRTHTEKQSKKTRRERIGTKNPFVITKSINKPVILVDDIYTTGTTLRHAGVLLQGHGCPKVYAYTLIRG
ncbi:DEAD/DEAH box helicase family protein [Virgibacillus sp. NKC19-3]|uniref:DEAD/DEAH box helicase n=1 Tax=Virgibacillus saliphilus TaxID=2831674 RepID=UPI001C9A3437|nr:DEAD/DEAH box helicase [Virgibacillus sp. NKC19-3]MBY7144116.1 DEAD/DEAH box helicase family protein [Virgibacillus sp. NKC19-3]